MNFKYNSQRRAFFISLWQVPVYLKIVHKHNATSTATLHHSAINSDTASSNLRAVKFTATGIVFLLLKHITNFERSFINEYWWIRKHCLLAMNNHETYNTAISRKWKLKIGHNGFNYNYRGVGKKDNKYRAKYLYKNPAKSYSPPYSEVFRNLRICYRNYLKATNGNKINLNFASESEYKLALDEE